MQNAHLRRRTRRDILRLGALAAASQFCAPALAQNAAGRVVVIGGGFAGATCACALKRLDPRLSVALGEPNAAYTACPFSNLVIAGLRDLRDQQFGYDGVRAAGVELAAQSAAGVDPQARTVTLADGTKLRYDRLIIAPGIDIRWDALPGYDEAAAEHMPHAWKAGPQTTLLRTQLDSMKDGGLVVMSAPANPFRCPPGPYERASLIAWYLKTRKPRSKLILLDAKDNFSKQKLFEQAWGRLYPGLIEWVALSSGGKLVSVDSAARTLTTEFQTYKADVANVIPPQRAGHIAELAGVADRSGWCPIDPATFASTLQPNIHVVGDAAIVGGMRKAGFAPTGQAKVCAAAVASLLAGNAPQSPKLINTCYSLAAPEYGFSVAGVYHPADGKLADVEGAGGTSPLDAPTETRKEEALLAEAWFCTITAEVFG